MNYNVSKFYYFCQDSSFLNMLEIKVLCRYRFTYTMKLFNFVETKSLLLSTSKGNNRKKVCLEIRIEPVWSRWRVKKRIEGSSRGIDESRESLVCSRQGLWIVVLWYNARRRLWRFANLIHVGVVRGCNINRS